MCQTCGCGDTGDSKVTNLQTGRQWMLPIPIATPAGHHHPHDHDHGHSHDHSHDHTHVHGDAAGAAMVELNTRILQKNDRLAEHNRGWLAGRGVAAVNLLSSPGAGKTTLLERTIRAMAGVLPIHVIEGDQATLQDAKRIQAAGCPVVQINTGAGCHLDAEMVKQGLTQLNPPAGTLVLIENVGNLVCPALFDLGEDAKVVVASVTEGEDKPIKYPHMFRAATLLLLNKVDLLPHVEFNVEQFEAYVREVNPGVTILRVSARTGEGMDGWCSWLRETAGLRLTPAAK